MDDAFKAALAEFAGGNDAGLYKRMVQVAFLRARSRGLPPFALLQETIGDFRTAIPTTYGAFAATASYARAVAHFGVADGAPLASALESVPDGPALPEQALAIIGSVHRGQASAARVKSGAGKGRGAVADGFPLLTAVRRAIQAAHTNPEGREEVEALRGELLRRLPWES